MTLLCCWRSSTCSSPAHSAIADLPVPALPPRETIPISGSSSRSSATRCSAERPWTPNASRCRGRGGCACRRVTRPSALELPVSTSPVWQGSSASRPRRTRPGRLRRRRTACRSRPRDLDSAMPVQPTGPRPARGTPPPRPTAPALTRSGMSLVTSVTDRTPRQVQRTGEDAVVVGVGAEPGGSTAGSTWLSSTAACRRGPRRGSARRAGRAGRSSSRCAGTPGRTSRAPGGGACLQFTDDDQRNHHGVFGEPGHRPGSERRTEVSSTYMCCWDSGEVEAFSGPGTAPVEERPEALRGKRCAVTTASPSRACAPHARTRWAGHLPAGPLRLTSCQAARPRGPGAGPLVRLVGGCAAPSITVTTRASREGPH